MAIPFCVCSHLAKRSASSPKLTAVNGRSLADVVGGGGFTVMVTVAVFAESAVLSLTTSEKV